MENTESIIISMLKKDYNGHIASDSLLSEIFEYDEMCYMELELDIAKKFKVDIEAFIHDIKTVEDLCKLVDSLLAKNKTVVATKQKPKQEKVTYKQFVESAKQMLKKSADNLDINKINLTTNLIYDFGMDSLNYIEMLYGLEKQYNFRIEDKTIQKMKSLNFGEICRLAYMSLTTKRTKAIVNNFVQNQMVR